MSKKIAFGSNHVVIDIPYGKSMKVHRKSDAETLKNKFTFIAKKFDIRIKVLMHETNEIAGAGVGPVLETRESIKVLEQTEDRPRDLEEHALKLAGSLLDICLETKKKELKHIKKEFKNGQGWANYLLASGAALAKMRDIVKAQGGDSQFSSTKLTSMLGNYSATVTASNKGQVTEFITKHITIISRMLGAPLQKGAGMYFHKKLGDSFEKGEALYTLYSESMYNLQEAQDAIHSFPVISF